METEVRGAGLLMLVFGWIFGRLAWSALAEGQLVFSVRGGNGVLNAVDNPWLYWGAVTFLVAGAVVLGGGGLFHLVTGRPSPWRPKRGRRS